MIQFESPKNQSSIIKVIGVGGGGGNAVNYMYELGIEGVDFLVCNTDQQALAQSNVPNKIQLGPDLTNGLGAGANPEIGRQAGEESVNEITEMLKVRTKMAFVTAGMGGGTGTGAAPVISKVCQELGILTVGIVTTPFAYEGRKRLKQAQEGIAQMREHVDTILIISNDKLREQYGNLAFSQAFAKADNILATAAKCITDLITVDGRVNLDFNDVQTVMKSGGVAILGSATASGESRAQVAVEEALNSPLLNDSEIEGAKWILLNITSAPGDFEHTLDELEIIQSYVQEKAGNNCDIILGMGQDTNLGENIAVTIIATGFKQNEIESKLEKREADKEVYVLNKDFGKVEPKTEAPRAEDAKEEIDPMVPTLVEASVPENLNDFNLPSTISLEEDSKRTLVDLELPSDSSPQIEDALNDRVEENKESTENKKVNTPAGEIKLIIKNTLEEEAVVQKPTINQRPAARPRTEHELESDRLFEEQKRILEERAERIKRLSFGLSSRETAEEMETIPAYIRHQKEYNEEDYSSESYLSNYYVGPDGGSKNNQTNIRSKNEFLDGEKPD